MKLWNREELLTMKKPTKNKLIIIGIISIVIIALSVFLAVRPSGATYKEEIAKVQDLNTYYSYEGNIEAEDSQIIYATATSTMKVYVDEGDIVSKGDLLYECGYGRRNNTANF